MELGGTSASVVMVKNSVTNEVALIAQIVADLAVETARHFTTRADVTPTNVV